MGHQEGEAKRTRSKPGQSVILVLRLLTFCATASATIVMALNKESKSIVVGIVGTTPIRASVTAKFQQTPAFVLFVIVNALASFHNLLMIVITLVGHRLDHKGRHFLIVAILDMMTVTMLSGGLNAALFMAELGKNGNSHAQWNKICNNFDKYCDHGGGAIMASFIGLGFLLITSIMSILTLQKHKISNYNVVP